MILDIILPILLLLAGLRFIVFGFKLLFRRGFVEKLREGPWKPDADDKVWSSKEGYFADKYIRGIRYFLPGLIMVVSAIYLLLQN